MPPGGACRSSKFLHTFCANVTIHSVIFCGLNRPPMIPQRFPASDAPCTVFSGFVPVFKNVDGVPVEHSAVFNRKVIFGIFHHNPMRGITRPRTGRSCLLSSSDNVTNRLNFTLCTVNQHFRPFKGNCRHRFRLAVQRFVAGHAVSVAPIFNIPTVVIPSVR